MKFGEHIEEWQSTVTHTLEKNTLQKYSWGAWGCAPVCVGVCVWRCVCRSPIEA